MDADFSWLHLILISIHRLDTPTDDHNVVTVATPRGKAVLTIHPFGVTQHITDQL